MPQHLNDTRGHQYDLARILWFQDQGQDFIIKVDGLKVIHLEAHENGIEAHFQDGTSAVYPANKLAFIYYQS